MSTTNYTSAVQSSPDPYRQARRYAVLETRVSRSNKLPVTMGGKVLHRAVKVPAHQTAAAYSRIHGQDVALILKEDGLHTDRVVQA